MKILITGGGCREAIDGVRCVTNTSTGRTAAYLADAFFANGASVTAVMAKGAVLPSCVAAHGNASESGIKLLRFESGADLSSAVQAELTAACERGEPYSAIVHAAAVSDFVPDTVTVGGVTYKAGKQLKKLHSGGEMTVTFREAPKIADSLRTWAGERAAIFCFKLTNGATKSEQQTAVDGLFKHSSADYVIRNDLTEITESAHPFIITARDGSILAQGATLSDMSAAITAVCSAGR